MTAPDRDYDDLVRRVLHALADPIEPTGDGLGRIRERMAQPWLRRQMYLLRTECADLGWLIFTRCEPALAAARSRLALGGRSAGRLLLRWYARVIVLAAAALRFLSPRAAARGGRSPERPQRTGLWGWLTAPTAWARPAVAVAVVSVIAAASVLGLSQFREALISLTNGTSSNSTSSSHAVTGPGGGTLGTGRAGQPVTPGGHGSKNHPASIGHSGTLPPGSSPEESCAPGVSPIPSSQPPATPTSSPPTTPPSSPTPTDSESPSPSDSALPPAGGITPSAASYHHSGSGVILGTWHAASGARAAAGHLTLPAICTSQPPQNPSPSASPGTSSTPPVDVTPTQTPPAGEGG